MTEKLTILELDNRVIILDDNELSIMKYAEEFPERWAKICEVLNRKLEKKK